MMIHQNAWQDKLGGLRQSLELAHETTRYLTLNSGQIGEPKPQLTV